MKIWQHGLKKLEDIPLPGLALIAALLPYYVGLLAMPSGITIEGDTGEFAAAVHGLGIIHSPGFPTFMVLASAFSWMLRPLIDAAQSLNLFSVLCSSATSSLIFLIGVELGCRRLTSLLGAWCFVFSYEFFYQSQIAEIYAFSLVFIAGLTYLALKMTPNNSARLWPGLLFLSALGIGAHVYVWALLPPLYYFLYRQNLLRPSLIFPNSAAKSKAILLFLAGFLPYLYIPWRAGRFLPVDMGGISSWQSFFDHVTWVLQRERSFGATEDVLRSSSSMPLWEVKWKQLLFLGYRFYEQWGMGLLLLLALGALVFVKRKFLTDKWEWKLKELSISQKSLARTFSFAMLYFFLIVWLGFSSSKLSISILGENQVHLILVYFFGILLVLLSCANLEASSQNGDSQKTSLALGLVLLITLYVNFPRVNLSLNQMAYSHARNLLEPLAPKAILIAQGDNDLMPTTYLQSVEGIRTDVRLINLGNGTKWYYENMKKRFPDLVFPSFGPGFLRRLFIENQKHWPVYFASHIEAEEFMNIPGMKDLFMLAPEAGAIRLFRKDEVPANHPEKMAPRRRIEIPGSLKILRNREWDLIAQYADFHLRQGAEMFSQGKKTEALREVELGLKYPMGATVFSFIIRRELQRLGNAILQSLQQEPEASSEEKQ